MNKFTLIFSLTLLLFQTRVARALEIVNVESLGQGSCWIGEEGEMVNLASFNERKSLLLGGFHLESFFEKDLRIKREQLKTLKTFVHCSAHGLALVFSFETSEGRLCAWAGLGQEGIVLHNFGHNQLEARSEFCDGAKFGELIILGKDGLSKGLIESELESIVGPGVDTTVSALTENLYKISLPRSFYGQEAKIRDRLLNSSALFNSVREVEFSPYYHPIGEVRELTQFSF